MISIYLIDAAPGILGSFDAKLAEYAAKKFQRDGIRVLNNRQVKAVERGRLVLEPDGEIAFGLVSRDLTSSGAVILFFWLTFFGLLSACLVNRCLRFSASQETLFCSKR